jgi:cytochrome c biogenesis protein CcmG/thiol:disulfide interchange protein DsbE
MVYRIRFNYTKGGCMKRWLLCALALTVLAQAEDLTPLEAGKEAPSFSLPSLSGNRESLSIWCGATLTKPFVNSAPQIVVLSFWATYCVPCQKEIPELTKFAEKHAADKIKFFLVNIDPEGGPKVEPFVKDKKYTLPVLLDPYRKTAERYGVRSLPALIVIGPDGIIRYSSVGFKEGVSLENKLEEVISAITQGRTVTVDKNEKPGETVAVPAEVPQESVSAAPVASAAPAAVVIAPKQKWHAVALLETGSSPEQVASELGVTKDDVQKWYDELKKMAIETWGKR